jgi:fused signal recognition particle receptor
MGIFDIFSKKEKNKDLEDGLKQSKDGLLSRITKAIAGKSSIDISVLDNLEEALVSSDVGLTTTIKIIDRIEARAAKDKYTTHNELERMIREEIAQLIIENSQKDLESI